MKHPTEERLRAYLDGELPLAAAAAVGDHLAGCAECAALAAGLRETADVFAGAMARVDALEPERWRTLPEPTQRRFFTGDAGPVDERTLRLIPVGARGPGREETVHAPTSDVAVTGAHPFRRPPRSAAPLLRWAAGIALAVAIGGSAAIASGILNVGSAPETTVAPAPAPAEAISTSGGGVFGRPVNGAMEVVLTRAPAGSRVIIAWTDAEDVLVEVAGAPEARVVHRDGEERMVANLADRAGVVRVTMPRGLRSATVVWQGRIVVQVAEGTVSPEGAAGEGVVLEAQR
jgi:anti-sigma factor RsiW